MTRVCPLADRAGHTPDDVADIVCHQQRACRVERHADRPPERMAVVAHETREHVERLAGRLAVQERTKITL